VLCLEAFSREACGKSTQQPRQSHGESHKATSKTSTGVQWNATYCAQCPSRKSVITDDTHGSLPRFDLSSKHTALFNTLQDNATSNLTKRFSGRSPGSTRLPGHIVLRRRRCFASVCISDAACLFSLSHHPLRMVLEEGSDSCLWL
jgi:hypothetical protein